MHDIRNYIHTLTNTNFVQHIGRAIRGWCGTDTDLCAGRAESLIGGHWAGSLAHHSERHPRRHIDAKEGLSHSVCEGRTGLLLRDRLHRSPGSRSKEIGMKAFCSIIALAAAATLLSPASSLAVQTVSGPLYEDSGSCVGTYSCSINFSNLPNIPGKYIRINDVNCYIGSKDVVFYTKLSIYGGGLEPRTHYVPAPMRSGYFTFGQQIDFVAMATSIRYFQFQMSNLNTATGNSISAECVISGVIFTP